ncbi:M48 family metalloprotease [Rhizohabitans arisaemae]|uniref:M48 family metalloprotease n=1 Tax=Rhizohabitans arisaemae TaxID=2720610 RepID=UPI0024B23BC8|nr:M48 family metalloprotease [Rhizohabitans arisaemae]
MRLLLILLTAAVGLNTVFFALWLGGLQAPPGDAGEAAFATFRNLQWPVTMGLFVYSMVSWARHRRVLPLAGTPFAEVEGLVNSLMADAGIRRTVTVRLGPRIGGRAYVVGLPRRPFLVFGPELLALWLKDEGSRTLFTAIARHEVAHLRSRDLWSYTLVTMLRVVNVCTGAFVLFALTLNATVARNENLPFELPTAVARVIALIVVIELVARVFLRAREHDADRYAAEGSLEPIVAALRDSSSTSAAPVLRGWLRRHPTRGVRRMALLEPERLLESSPGQVFLGACTGGVFLVTLQDMLLRFTPSASHGDTPIATGLIVGIPLTLFVAYTAWRDTWYAGLTGGRPKTLVTAAVLSAGLVVGSYAALYTRVSGYGDTGIPLRVSTILGVAAGALLLCGWLSLVGSTWFRVDPAGASLKRFTGFSVPAAAVVGGWVFAVVWTWSARLRGILLGCGAEEFRDHPVCLSPTPEADILGTVPGLVLSPWLAVAAVAAALPITVPRLIGPSTAKDPDRG